MRIPLFKAVALLSSFLIGFSTLKAQYDTLRTIALQLNSLAGDHQGRSGFMMDPWDDFNQELYDSLLFEMEKRIDSIPFQELFHLDTLLKESYVRVGCSSDSMIKTFSWEYINGGSMEETDGFILAQGQNGKVFSIERSFSITDIITLNPIAKHYLILGYNQFCTTCFKEYALAVSLSDTFSSEDNYLETEDYRHNYFYAQVINYDSVTQQLSISYKDVILEKDAFSEKNEEEVLRSSIEKNTCYQYRKNGFFSIPCPPSSNN